MVIVDARGQTQLRGLRAAQLEASQGRPILKQEFHRELNLARRGGRRGKLGERRVDGCRSVGIRNEYSQVWWRVEIRVVENVKEFGAELNTQRFGDSGVFHHCRVKTP